MTSFQILCEGKPVGTITDAEALGFGNEPGEENAVKGLEFRLSLMKHVKLVPTDELNGGQA